MIARNKTLECDVLVIGGGTSGMMAAIYAAKAGASVILAEKANTRRSGAGATGNDHFQCYIPEVHGSLEDFMKLYMHDRPGPGPCKDMDLIMAFVKGSFDLVKDWEAWGVPMRPHGYWEFTGHCLPWILGTHLKYEGVDQKPVFTREALKAGVKILNRHPAMDVITDDHGAVCGAVCLDLTTEEPKMQLIRCKSAILCTAKGAFLNASDRSMGPVINEAQPFTNTGDGVGIAYRAGARIINARVSGKVERDGIGATRYMSRGGTRTWVGVYTDINGTPYAPMGTETTYDVLNPGAPGEAHTITWPDYKTGEYTQYIPENKMKQAYAKGQPVFMNFSYNTKEDTEYMKWALVHEGQGAMLDHLADEGFDFERHMIEFNQGINGGGYPGGPDVNGRGETTVKGLYAAGEAMGNLMPGLSPAAVIGRVAGENAAAYSKTVELGPIEDRPVVAEDEALLNKLLSNPVSSESPTYQEARAAIQQIMLNYCASGVVSEELFEVGLQHLRRLRKKMEGMQAGTVHDLMNCVAVLNIAESAELTMEAGRARKESRGPIKYVNYPEIDHQYDNKYFAYQKVDGKLTFSTREYVTEVKEG